SPWGTPRLARTVVMSPPSAAATANSLATSDVTVELEPGANRPTACSSTPRSSTAWTAWRARGSRSNNATTTDRPGHGGVNPRLDCQRSPEHCACHASDEGRAGRSLLRGIFACTADG